VEAGVRGTMVSCYAIFQQNPVTKPELIFVQNLI